LHCSKLLPAFRLAEAHARTSAVLIDELVLLDELHADRLKHTANGQVIGRCRDLDSPRRQIGLATCAELLKPGFKVAESTVSKYMILRPGPPSQSWKDIPAQPFGGDYCDRLARWWSGVYYVPDGKPDGNDPFNDRLELIGPRVGVNMLRLEPGVLEGRYLVEPMPGLRVMFPSWLKHMVHPFHGPGERISISFNVIVQVQQQTRCGRKTEDRRCRSSIKTPNRFSERLPRGQSVITYENETHFCTNSRRR
jgi:hypothetical protein